MRIKVTTTIEEILWRRLQVQAIKEGFNVNDILEVLISDYLKIAKASKSAKKGGV